MHNHQGIKELSESISELQDFSNTGGVFTKEQQEELAKLKEQLECAQGPKGHTPMFDLNGVWFCSDCEYELGFNPYGKAVDVIGMGTGDIYQKASPRTTIATLRGPVAIGSPDSVLPAWVYPSGGAVSVSQEIGKSCSKWTDQQTRSNGDNESSEQRRENHMSWIGDFDNKSGLEFTNIDSEDYRTYTYVKEGKEIDVTIKHPLKLNVSPSGGHRIWDGEGISHYMPAGWIHLRWKARAGNPHFTK